MNRIFLFLTLFVFAPLFQDNEKWSYDDYEIYDYQTIVNFDAANLVIDDDDLDIPLLNAVIFYETNRQRVLNHLSPFIFAIELEKSAQGHSDDMVKFNFFSHSSVVKGKKTSQDRIDLVGGKRFSLNCAENIADYFILQIPEGKPYSPPSSTGRFQNVDGTEIRPYTYIDFAKFVVNGWMNSAGHRRNILDPDYTHLGVGCSLHYEGSGIDEIPYVKCTQNFSKVVEPIQNQ